MNSTFGYQMKYPADYSAKDASKGSTISKGTLNGSPYYRVDVVVYETPITGGREGQDIYTWAKNGFPQDANVEKEHANLRQVTLGGITYWASDGDLGSTPIPDFMVFHDNKLFVLTDYRTVDKNVDTNRTIISSFKFTDPTAGWKTYSSQDNTFSFQYPDTWTKQSVGCGAIGCTESAGFTPTTVLNAYKTQYGNDSFWMTTMSVHSSDITPEQWFDQVISPSSRFDISRSAIGGHTAYYAKITTDSYTDLEYIIDNSTKLVRFHMRSQSTHYSTTGSVDSSEDYSQYVSDFTTMVHSISFR